MNGIVLQEPGKFYERASVEKSFLQRDASWNIFREWFAYWENIIRELLCCVPEGNVYFMIREWEEIYTFLFYSGCLEGSDYLDDCAMDVYFFFFIFALLFIYFYS